MQILLSVFLLFFLYVYKFGTANIEQAELVVTHNYQHQSTTFNL